MPKRSNLYNHIHSRIIDQKQPGQRNISFSQYSVFSECKYRWWLTYGKGNYPFSSSIHTIFGDAIHQTLQEYLRLLYEESIKSSEDFKMFSFFEQKLKENYLEEKKKNENKHFSSLDEISEFYEDGCKILAYVKKNRKKFFDNKNMELIGIELPLYTKIFDDNDKFVYNAFLDIVFYDHVNDILVIIDFKTSTKGWGDYEKKNKVKNNQVLLYKKFISKQMDIPESKIEVKFIILKRKIYENADWPIPRIQTHIPAQGTSKIKDAHESIVSFINECYDQEGNPLEKNYEPNPGNACRFCPFSKMPELCSANSLKKKF